MSVGLLTDIVGYLRLAILYLSNHIFRVMSTFVLLSHGWFKMCWGNASVEVYEMSGGSRVLIFAAHLTWGRCRAKTCVVFVIFSHGAPWAIDPTISKQTSASPVDGGNDDDGPNYGCNYIWIESCELWALAWLGTKTGSFGQLAGSA